MNWLIFVIITVILDSARIFIDNYTSDYYFKKNGAVSQKLFHGYAFVIFSLIILIFAGIDFSNPSAILLFVTAGFLGSIAGIPYYRALELDDSTNLGIFVQLAPILYLILGWLFLGETLSMFQLISFVFIVAAPILIIATTRKRSRKIKIKAIFYSFIYVLISIVGNLLFVKEHEVATNLNFASQMALLFLGKGLGNLLIVYTRPKWRRRFITIYKSSHRKILKPLICNDFISLIKDFTYRAALTMAPSVALASAASDSSTPIVIFFMGIVLTIIWPNFGREKLNRKTVTVHLLATILVVAGIILMQFS